MVNIYIETDALADIAYKSRNDNYSRLTHWPFPNDEKVVLCTAKYVLVVLGHSTGNFVGAHVSVVINGKTQAMFACSGRDEEIIWDYRKPNKPTLNQNERACIVNFFFLMIHWVTRYNLPEAKKLPLSLPAMKMRKNGIKGNSYHLIAIETPTNRYIPLLKEDCHKTDIRQRYHMRRGHFRLLKNGNKVWVRSCYAGDIELGIVHKDYAITA